MQHERRATRAIWVLVVCGVIGLTVRYQSRHSAQLGLGDTAWRLTYSVESDTRREGATLSLAAPADTEHCRVLRQDLRQQNLRMDPRGRSSAHGRDISALVESPGRSQATLRFDLRLNPRARWFVDDEQGKLGANQRAEYLRGTSEVQVEHESVVDVLTRVRQPGQDSDELVRALFRYCREHIAINQEGSHDAASVLDEEEGSPVGCARALVALGRAAKIPARLVAGFILEPGREVEPHVWAEVYLGDRWLPHDPVNGYERELPYNFIPARRGSDQVVVGRHVRSLDVTYSIVQLPRASFGTVASGHQLSDILDLTRLPLEMQRVLSLVLLMPLGALLTCVFRNLIGLKTSGTFTPTLLALSFVFADWRTGFVVLVAAVVLGILTRYVIDGLKLLILPRLSIMLTTVVACMVFGVSTLEYLRVAPGTQAVLLPMVILTMLIERFYLTTQEDGLLVAIEHFAGTFIVGFCCYWVLRWETIAQLLLAYPEAHLFTLALLVSIGRYTGYQLWEPIRFRDLAPPSRAGGEPTVG